MRYIGNKTRLLEFIGGVLRRRGITGGTAVDPFCGTASVARALKRRGFRVLASDVLELGHVFARAYVQASALPDLSALAAHLGADGARGSHGSRTRSARERRVAGNGNGVGRADGAGRAAADAVVAWLNRLPPRPGFIAEHFSPAGSGGRMYFTAENAGRIDAIRSLLGEWCGAGLVGDDGFYLLVTALVEAADRVANTTGVYASYVKSWQPNAQRPLHLRLPRVVPGAGSRALRADARTLVPALEPFDLLYIDPPYNNRQYPAYYHIPEIIAMGWAPEPPVLRGKVGLMLHDTEKRSPFTSRRKGPAVLEELVARAPCRHVALSYNAEGVIPEATIARILKTHGRRGSYFCYKRHYKRYRSDADGEGRRYSGDVVEERLYCIER